MKKKFNSLIQRALAVTIAAVTVVTSSSVFTLLAEPVTVHAANTFSAASGGSTSIPSAGTGVNVVPSFNKTGAVTYYLGNNGWYGVTDGTSYWELVDTDAKINSTSLKSTWGSGYDGSTILNYANGLVDTYFSTLKSGGAMKTQTVNTTDYSSSGKGSITGAYMWPLSYTQYKNNSTLAGKLYSGAGASVWSRSFSNYDSSSYFAWYVGNSSGSLSNNFGSGVTGSRAVAPAFYLDLSKVLITRGAQSPQSFTAYGGSGAYMVVNVGTAYANGFSVKYDGSTSISGKKLTGFSSSGSYTLNFSNATSGGNIVAILYGSDGKIKYFGKIGSASSTSGTATLDLSNVNDGTYTMAVYEEDSTNGYASTPVVCTLNVSGDYHTGINVVNNNDDVLSSGDQLSTENVTAEFTSYLGTMSTSVPAANIYLCEASAWESNRSASNTSLAKTLTIPDSDSTSYSYYVIVKDSTVSSGYIASNKYSADGSENSVDFDANVWYTKTENGIEWNYKLNSNGDIIGLYTESSIVPIVDTGRTLNVPSKVADRTVIGIGSGTKDHPFIPASEKSWTSISFPSTVSIIHDYAFFNTTAEANLVIPSTITNIGVGAFYGSTLYSLKINDMNGAVGSIAFAECNSLTDVSIKAGSEGLTISKIAFRDAGEQNLSISGKVTVNKNAFKGNTRLNKLYISGTVVLNEYAFSGCQQIDTLNMSGKVNVGEYAFNGLTSLEHLYLPQGISLSAYSFNGLTSLTYLETDVDLVAHSFEGCGKIKTIILDEHVGSVAYNWEGGSSSFTDRKIYVRNKDTIFTMYGSGGTYVSPFGSSGSIIVYILPDQNDQGLNVEASDNVLSLVGYTCYAHGTADQYKNYITGKASSVTFYVAESISSQIKNDDITTDYDEEISQTGINAYYDGVILTTMDIDKENMTVFPMYSSNVGTTPYDSSEFYIIRTSEFNSLASDEGSGVTEENVSALEPIHVNDSDIKGDQTTGTLSVTVVVFYTDENEAEKYFSAPVSIRIEKYSSKSYVEQTYGSYDKIVAELARLSSRVEQLETELANWSGENEDLSDKLNEMSRELVVYKQAYDELLEEFTNLVKDSTVDETGYFGKYEDPSSGETVDVVYIEGQATSYTDTGETTASGETIYVGEHDVDGDGEPDTVKFFVDADGVHIVDDDGNETGDVYKDTLGVVERKLTAELNEVQASLKVAESGLADIIAALKTAGYEFDLDITIDDAYKEIVKDINDMASKISDLESDLSAANTSVSQYSDALARIYALLTNSTLEKDNISTINDALVAITTKITSLQNQLVVANATVTDLQGKLSDKESEISALDEELETTKEQLKQANQSIADAETAKAELEAQYQKAIEDGDTAAAAALEAQIKETEDAISQLKAVQSTLAQKELDIKEAQDTITLLRSQIADKNQEIESLQAQLAALTDTADGFKITVETANKMFGLSLPDGSTDKEIADAIDTYVKQKVSADETIAAIQKVVGSSNTGMDLVADVKTAVASGNGSSTEGMIDDTVINSNSNNYKTGYQNGYAAGLAANPGGMDDSVVNENSNNYKSGYAAGLVAGAAGKTDDSTVNVSSQSYKQGYSTGYNEGYLKAVKDLGSSSNGDDGSDTDTTSSATIAKLQEQLENMTSQVTSLSTKNSELTEQVSTLNTSVSNLTSENTSLKKKVSSLEDDVDDLEDDNKDLKSTNKDLESKNSTLSSQVSSLNSDVSDLKNTNSSLQTQVSDLNSKNGTLSTQVSDLTSKNSSLTTEVSDLKSQKTTTSASTGTTSTSSTNKNTTSTSSASTKSSTSTKTTSTDDEDEDDLEGSTSKIDTKADANKLNADLQPEAITTDIVSTGTDSVKLGTTKEVSMFSDAQITSVAAGQYAKGSVIKFSDSNPIVKISDSNGKGVNDISTESLDNVYKIMNYYANHVEELGNLGSDDVVNAAANESKDVVLDVVAAGDILPSATQESAFNLNQSAKLNVSFPNITNGALYLVVHERADQAGQYEVCLTTAASDSVSMNVSSLSPVVVAKVQIKDAESTVNSTLTDNAVDTLETPAEENSNKNGVGTIFVILFIIIVFAVGLVCLFMKLKKDGRLPEFLSFT